MSRPRVLVIDDDPLFRSLMMSMLRKEFLVSVASGGEEGFYKAIEHTPDLAVIDIRMPGWDGLRTLSAFRTHQTLSKIPIIMLTADASRRTVMSAIQAGASDYVLKTCLNRDDFLRKVRKLLKLIDSTAVAAPLKTNPAPAAPEHEPAQAVAVSEPAPLPVEPVSESPAEQHLVAASAAHEEAELQSIIDNWE